MDASLIDTFNGLPLHPLVVHAAVILTPVAALFSLTLLRPQWRYRLRWPVAGALFAAWLLVWLTRETGETFERALGSQIKAAPALHKAIEEHSEWADKLNVVLFVLVVVAVLFAWLLPKLPSGAGTVGAVVIALLALGVVGLVAITGDEGARAAWNPDGSQDYSVK